MGASVTAGRVTFGCLVTPSANGSGCNTGRMPDTEERQPRLTGERADRAVKTSATTAVDLIADGATPTAHDVAPE